MTTSRQSELPLVAGALALVGLCAAALPLRSWDYWYHLTVGRLLAVHRAIPTTNLFGYTADTTAPIFVQSWIGDYWLYLLHDLGGLAATLAARNLCALAALTLVAFATWRLANRNGTVTAVITLAAGLLFLAAGAFAGPQMFAWPLFGLLLALYTLGWERRVPVAALALTSAVAAAFWANTANGFWAPALIAFAFAFAERRRGESRRALLLAAGGLGAIFAMSATPHGLGIVQGLFEPTGIEVWLFLGAPVALAPIIDRFPRRPLPLARPASVAIAAFLAAATLAAQPWTERHAAIPAAVFGDDVRQTEPLRGWGPATIPVEAVELMRTWGSQPRVYAEPHLSGYILYEIQDPRAPERVVWPVPDRIAPPELTALERAMYTDAQVLRGALQQYEVDAVLVTPDVPQFGQLMQSLPTWQLVASWPSGALYTPRR